MKAAYILWLRQVKKYFRSKSRIAASLAQPLLFLFGLGYGFGSIYARAGAGDYIQFLAPGVITMGLMFTAIFSGIEIIWDKQFGFLKETLVAPVPRLHIMFGRALGGATVALIQGVIVFLVTLLSGFHPYSLPMVFVGIFFMFMVSLLFTIISTSLALKIDDMQAFPLIINFFAMPLFFLSGSLFPIGDNLPKVLYYVTLINPLSYGVDAVRGAFTGNTHFGFGVDFLVLTAIITVVLAIGARLSKNIEA